jgi:excisionase family DNA binding protein
MARTSRRILDAMELPEEALLTVGQVARLLNASERYVRQLLASGEIKSLPWGESRERRVPRWAIKRWQETALSDATQERIDSILERGSRRNLTTQARLHKHNPLSTHAHD